MTSKHTECDLYCFKRGDSYAYLILVIFYFFELLTGVKIAKIICIYFRKRSWREMDEHVHRVIDILVHEKALK